MPNAMRGTTHRFLLAASQMSTAEEARRMAMQLQIMPKAGPGGHQRGFLRSQKPFPLYRCLPWARAQHNETGQNAWQTIVDAIVHR